MGAWVAGFRSAVINPYEEIRISEPRGFRDQTVRQIVRPAGGGEQVRVRLSNRYGRAPLAVGSVEIARSLGGSEVAGGVGVFFGGEARVVVPVGEEVVSDPVGFGVAAGERVALSLHLPEETGLATYEHMPIEISYVGQGDQVGAKVIENAEEVEGRYYVTGIDVLAEEGTRIAVAFGDSWFEGVGSTVGADRRSVDVLNERLGQGWAVNQGVSGNRLLTDEIGEHALARFERDVLEVPGVSHVLFHFGINDLGLPGMVGQPPARAEDLIQGFVELTRRAREAGLVVLGSTIGPFGGAIFPGVATPEGLAERRKVNDRLRADQVFDSLFDVAAAVEDANRPGFIRPEFAAPDGMHLNDAGARAMAESVDITAISL